MKIVLSISAVIFISILSCKNSENLANKDVELENNEEVNPLKFNVHSIKIIQRKPFLRSWEIDTLAFLNTESRDISEKINHSLNELNEYCYKIDDAKRSNELITISILSDKQGGIVYSKKLTNENFSMVYNILASEPLDKLIDMESLYIIYNETVIDR